MKKLSASKRWLLLILINAAPFVLDVLFYRTGSVDELFWFVPVLLALTFCNFKWTNKFWEYLVLNLFDIFCIVGEGAAATYLYYHNVSSDPETPLVGAFMIMVEVCAVVIIAAVVSAVRGMIWLCRKVLFSRKTGQESK